MRDELQCPLCSAQGAGKFYEDSRRRYLRCERCLLVFVPAEQYLDLAAERAIYDQHENRVDDLGYRQFLSRLADPLIENLGACSHGLDFGCGPGPGPALAAMLTEAGHQVALYDAYYFPDEAVLGRRYDFICATEVVEHLHHPGTVLASLWGQLMPGGYLGVMTKLVLDLAAFSGWHYKNDLTHVCFFSRATWSWWSETMGASLQFIGNDVMILQKPAQGLRSSIEL